MSAKISGSVRAKVLPRIIKHHSKEGFDGLTPLSKIKYSQQLKMKQHNLELLLKTLVSKLKGINSSILSGSDNLPCPVEKIIPSPVVDGYRNTDDFSIWPGPDGNPKTVGYIMGKTRNSENPPICLPPDNCRVVKKSHILLASKFQHYLRHHSPLSICQNFSKGGNWKRFVVRSNDINELMGVAILHPQDLSSEQLNEEENRLRGYFDTVAPEIGLKSLYFQACPGVRCTHEKAPFRLVLGDEYIEEIVNGKLFRISPEPFFQINKGAAEKLYQTIIEEIEPESDMTVLDLCCGSGVLAVQLASQVHEVIGIDSCRQAIKDAEANAKANKVTNCRFIHGEIENNMSEINEQRYSDNLVMVVNPGSGGLQSGVVNVIRTMTNVSKLIYVSCKPEGEALKNFAHLCLPFRPMDYIQGDPFVPVKATPVDLFPHTNRCELVFTFSRY